MKKLEKDCLFCKIADHDIPSEAILEDDNTISILDIMPRAPGHTMVIPKRHSMTILEVGEEELGPLFSAVKRTTSLLEKALRPDGFTIGINHGRASGQAIDHLHVHIIPRYEGDGGGSLHSVVVNPPHESLKELKEKILSHE